MGPAYKEFRDFDSGAGNALVQAVAARAAGFQAHASALRGHSSILSAWDGDGRSAANSAFEQNQAYAEAAKSSATELAASLGRVVGARTRLQEEISNIIEDGSRLRFTISDSGEINDFYGSSGLAGELPADQQALYLKLKSELPVRVAQAVATGEGLDQDAAGALTRAAGLQAPGPLAGATAAQSGAPLGWTSTDTGQGVITINTGAGDDNVSVTETSSGVVVTVNGVSKTFTDKTLQYLINTQGGNDTITVSPNVDVRLRLIGGTGNDTINAAGIGGAYVDGGDGDDVITLGAGHNYAFGGAGKNKITGTKGFDYIDAGTGASTVNAGSGDSILVGDTGTNTINAGAGHNTVYTGAGHNTIVNQGGQDKVYAESNSTLTADPAGVGKNTVVTVAMATIPSAVHVQGTAEFQAQVAADLQMLASSPDGQAMLAGISNSGHTLTIDDGHLLNDGKTVYQNSFTFGANADGTAWTSEKNTEYVNQTTGAHGVGSNSIISFDSSIQDFTTPVLDNKANWEDQPPVVTLFHEMAHAYDYTNGTMMNGTYNGTDTADRGVANAEREAVGLTVDWDKNTKTPETKVPDAVHPNQLTENGLLAELGIPDRPHYAI